MNPATIINLCAAAAAIATASPSWGCYDRVTHPYPVIADRIASDIIVDENSSLPTKIKSVASSDVAYSGYDLIKMDLKEYLSLEDGWDGPESKAASTKNVKAALKFIDELPPGIPLPKSMLSTSGEVGLYWDVDAIYADVSFEEEILTIFLRDRRCESNEIFEEIKPSDMLTSHLKNILAPLALA